MSPTEPATIPSCAAPLTRIPTLAVISDRVDWREPAGSATPV